MTDGAPNLVIVPSIGRCGSTLVTNLIAEALGVAHDFARDYRTGDCVRKTHSHFEGDLTEPYRAVFVCGGVGDIIRSLTIVPNQALLPHHFAHLQMAPDDIEAFRRSPNEAGWIHLVEGDRFRFRDNIRSWERATHVMFVVYEELCANPEAVVASIGQFIGTPLRVPKIRARHSSWRDLPPRLLDAIRVEYGDVTAPPRDSSQELSR